MNLQEKSQNFFQNYAFFGRKSRLDEKAVPEVEIGIQGLGRVLSRMKMIVQGVGRVLLRVKMVIQALG